MTTMKASWELRPITDEDLEFLEADTRRSKGRPDRRRRLLLQLIVRMKDAEAKLKGRADERSKNIRKQILEHE